MLTSCKLLFSFADPATHFPLALNDRQLADEMAHKALDLQSFCIDGVQRFVSCIEVGSFGVVLVVQFYPLFFAPFSVLYSLVGQVFL